MKVERITHEVWEMCPTQVQQTFIEPLLCWKHQRQLRGYKDKDDIPFLNIKPTVGGREVMRTTTRNYLPGRCDKGRAQVQDPWVVMSPRTWIPHQELTPSSVL